jgi:hypothetical protein
MHMAYQESVAALDPWIAVEAAKREGPYLQQHFDRLVSEYLARRGQHGDPQPQPQ